MAAMSTVLELQARQGHSSTYLVPATHTAVKPNVVLQRRKVPTASQRVLEDTIVVSDATEDANGVILDSRVSLTVVMRRDKNSISADRAAALTRFRDIVAGDEFANVWNNQHNLA